MNADNLINYLIRWIFLLFVALFFLSGDWVNADPVGDFFKKVGQSISKAFQPPPAQPQPAKKKRASRRPASGEANVAEAEPSPLQEPSKPAKEERLRPTVLPPSAAPAQKAKGDMPYGIPVPGQKGFGASRFAVVESRHVFDL
ncbi:MAG: hypothetical protein DMF41_04115 [Verrucomicrobia bacterium]|nr:MAG: hypothetical protein DMF41_04115 [Verrucomicrobiota bacterium]